MKNKIIKTLAFTLLVGMTNLSSAFASGSSLTVFNTKEGSDISAIFQNFEKETGIPVTVVNGSLDSLLKKLQNGETADVLIVNDVVNFSAVTKEGLFQPVESTTLNSSIPANFREGKNRWFGLSYKIRTLMYNPAQVDASSLDSYEDLADPKWKGKLCLRNSGKTYNRALVASLITQHGIAGAQKIIQGWVANLAHPVFDGDQKLLDAIAAGKCTVGITNTYYLGRMLTKNPSFPIRPFWANQKDRGAHANIAGMGLLKLSSQKELATRLMEFIASDHSQRIFADSNFEFPVNPRVRPSTVIDAWGDFKIDSTPVSLFGDLSDLAAEISLGAGYL